MATASLAPTGFAPTLADRLWPQSAETSPAFRALRFVGLALVGTLLLTLSAKIKVPFYPVEMTMQTFMILALAAAYGRNLAVATVLLYLAQGAHGVAGLYRLTGARHRSCLHDGADRRLSGRLCRLRSDRRRRRRPWLVDVHVPKMALAMLVGLTALFVLGVAWLSTLIGFDGAIVHGVLPFLLGDATKLALAALSVPAGMALLKPRD
jgi:biotin transport system substrate-specific component